MPFSKTIKIQLFKLFNFIDALVFLIAGQFPDVYILRERVQQRQGGPGRICHTSR
jgi:hypothetical protein